MLQNIKIVLKQAKPLYEAGFCHLKMVQKHVIMQFSDTKIFYKSIGVK